MKFKPETIAKIRKQLLDLKTDFLAMLASGVKLSVSITKGNRKIGDTHNISLPPMLSCGEACKVCCDTCYDGKACLQYENVRKARAKNYAILEHDFNDYWQQINKYLNRNFKSKYFRYHVGGDIPSYEYFEKMVETAEKHSNWFFWTYTKQYHFVNKYVRLHGGKKSCIPTNLSIMFSEWRPLPMYNPYGFAEFRFIEKEKATAEYLKGKRLCNGNCQYCINNKCHCIANQTTYVVEH